MDDLSACDCGLNLCDCCTSDCDGDCCCCCCCCCDQDCDFDFASCLDACCWACDSNYIICCCNTRTSDTGHRHAPRWRTPRSHTHNFDRKYESEMEERRRMRERERREERQEDGARQGGGYCSCGRRKVAGQKYCPYCLEDSPPPLVIRTEAPPTQSFDRLPRPQEREGYFGPHESDFSFYPCNRR